jgi:predicted LPLAT superfamily acyltransferase
MAAVTAPDDAAPTGWLAVAERGSVMGIRLVVWLATALGRAPTRLLLRAVAAYYVLARPSVRRVSRRYLERIHGRATLGMVYAHVLRFAEVALDRVFIVCGKDHYFEVTRTGHDYLEQLGASRRGAILLGAHLGSFEAMRMQADREGFSIHFLGQFRNARMINAALTKLNPRSNARLIAKEEGIDFMLRIREKLRQGDRVAILGDRVGRGERAAEVDFLGAKARFPTGPYLLAALLKCPIYLTFGLYRAPHRYDLFCEPFEQEIQLPRSGRDEALHAYAQKFATRLEHYVRLAPDNWFNFYDFWSAS